MNFENFEEYFSRNININGDKFFQEKIDLLLSTDKNKIELNKKEKQKQKEEESIKQRKLKDESNEKKIDFILSDENSFEKYEKKLLEKEEENEEEYNIDNIFFKNYPKEIQKIQNEESSNISNTENLINNERKGKDAELIKMGDDIKKNNPSIYNPKKIKKFKEMKDLKIGLQNKEINNENLTNNKNFHKKENNVNKNIQKKNVNKAYSSKKLISSNLKNNIIKEIKKEIKQEENDDDLIISLIQCPIQPCQKIRKDLKNQININNSIHQKDIKEENKNNREINNSLIKHDTNNNESLLNIYKKEKEIKNQLHKIFLSNQNISENDFFSEENENNQFYNFDSNSKYLTKAKEILLDDLSEEEKKIIWELDEKIKNVKKQISDINNEKNKYNEMIELKKNEIIKFESERNKEEFEYERELINELRSVINKFKMEIYKKELGINNKKESDDDNVYNEAENEELQKVKDEYTKVKNELSTINKNNEKFIADIKKKIMILKYENEQMKEKIEYYQQSEDIEKIEDELNMNENLLLLNQERKKIKNYQIEDEQNIIINRDLGPNNIIKTSSKNNHLKELDFEFPEQYFKEDGQNNKIIKHKFDLDGKTIKIYNNNKKEIIFPNNTKKEVFPDGYTLVYYSNGDIKEIIPNNKEIYYYKKDQVYQVNFNDGSNYIKYLKTGKIFCDGNPIN